MFQVLSGQTIIMFLMIIVGYVIYRTRLVDHEGNRSISNVLLLVVTPAMVLSSLFSIEYNSRIMKGLFISLFLSFLSHFAVIAVTQLILRKKRADQEIGMERYLAVYSNCGFMGIPLVSSVFGAEAVLYMTGYMIAFNVLNWTHGLIEITGETSFEKVRKGLMSPTVISALIGILFFALRIPVEAHLMRAIEYVGSMNTPMGMIVAGIVLAETGLGGIWKKPRVFLVTALKLIVAPTVVFALLMLARCVTPLSDELFYAILIPAACPTATTGTMMALRYDKDFEYTSQVFVVSTLLSMITIPVVISIARSIAH